MGIGDTICVYKANMIIPQIAENLEKVLLLRFRSFVLPAERAEIHCENEVEALCTTRSVLQKKSKLLALLQAETL